MPSLTGTAKIIWTASHSARDIQDFANRLQQQEIALTQITEREAEESLKHEPNHPGDRRKWAFFEEEVVAVDSSSEVFRLRRGITGKDYTDMQIDLWGLPPITFKRSLNTDYAIQNAVRKAPPPPDSDDAEQSGMKGGMENGRERSVGRDLGPEKKQRQRRDEEDENAKKEESQRNSGQEAERILRLQNQQIEAERNQRSQRNRIIIDFSKDTEKEKEPEREIDREYERNRNRGRDRGLSR